MKQSNISTEELRANELQALQNALHSFNLTGYDVHEWKQRNNKIKGLYFLTDQKGISLTGHWGYSEINHFIMGYGKAAKEVIELREALKHSINVIKQWHNADEVWHIYFNNAPEMKLIKESLKNTL